MTLQRHQCNERQCVVVLVVLFLLQFLLHTASTAAFFFSDNRYQRKSNILKTFPRTNHCRRTTTFLRTSIASPNLGGFMDSVATLLRGSSNKKDCKDLKKLQDERKEFLLSLVRPALNGEQTSKVVPLSVEIDQAIDALAEISPITTTDEVSKQLERTWSLVWTTEKEINLFLERGWSKNITQQIMNGNSTIINTIPFVNDNGYFGVTGRIFRSPDNDPMIRTQFVFETATLQFSWLPTKLSFPPVGKGWFDTVYLDNNFRVDRNSRNDILICRSLE